MMTHQTLQSLRTLKLTGMADGLERYCQVNRNVSDNA